MNSWTTKCQSSRTYHIAVACWFVSSNHYICLITKRKHQDKRFTSPKKIKELICFEINQIQRFLKWKCLWHRHPEKSNLTKLKFEGSLRRIYYLVKCLNFEGARIWFKWIEERCTLWNMNWFLYGSSFGSLLVSWV